MRSPNLIHLCARAAAALAAALLLAAPPAAFSRDNAPPQVVTPSYYQLSIRDQIELTVYGEPDLSVAQRIDSQGQVRVPLLGTVRILGMTVRQAEEFIQRSYVDQRILRQPMVTIRVADYAPKEVSVFGAVATPGKLAFPIEANSLNIVDVIAQMGGFTGIAKSNSVQVTRTAGGQQSEFTVDVESMITDRKRRGNNTADVQILPGDVIWVPERLF